MNLRTLASLIALCCVLSAPALHARAPDTVFIEALTWTELKSEITAGKTTVLIPIGGTEQNGTHMVLGKHNARARALAEQIARALGNALVAPVVAYTPEGSIHPPSGHMRFPGTLTIPSAVFEQLLESASRSLRSSGFADIVFLGDHGGYQASLSAVATRLNREWKSQRVHPLPEYYAASSTGFAQSLAQKGFSAAEIGSHAGLADTSLAMAIDLQLVRTDALPGARDPAQGVHGDARRASADLGKPGVQAIVDASVAAIRRAAAQP